MPHSLIHMEVFMNIESKVRELIQEKVEEKGYTISDIIFEKEGPNQFLRIVIDKEGFITLDDCVIVTETINPILDNNDIIDEQYILDVCSKEKGSN